jgi:hypothetical protein
MDYVIVLNDWRLTDLCSVRSASRVKKALSDHLRKVVHIKDSTFMMVARGFVPLYEALAAKITHLADINRQVHMKTYNKIISDAMAVPDGGGAATCETEGGGAAARGS